MKSSELFEKFHKEFLKENWRSLIHEGGILYDVKGILDVESIDARL